MVRIIPPPPVFPKPPSKVPRRIVMGILLLALMAIAAYGLYTFLANQYGWGVVPWDQDIVLVSVAPPVAGAIIFGSDTTPFTMEGVGTAVVIDGEEGSQYGYYLIANQERTESNLYRQERTHPEQGLTQLTNSPTLKFDLSYDALTGTAAYTVLNEDGSTSISVWSPESETEHIVGNGIRPTLLAGGFFVVYQNSDSILSANTRTNETYELLSIVPGMPFAVEPVTGQLALYSPVDSSVQFFTVMPKTSASFESQKPVVGAPQSLLYHEGKLTAAYIVNDTLSIQAVDGGRILAKPAPGFSLAGYSVILHHEK